MFKKILKIAGVLLLLIVTSLFAIPYFFKDQIKNKIETAINEKVDAKVSFANADLSLFKDFPNANVTLEKLLIINKAPFAGDTLVSFGELNLKMSIKELFKSSGEAMNIDGISSKNGIVNILFNKDGIGNFDIALKDKKSAENDGKSAPLNLKISNYIIENFRFKYFDETSKIKFVLDSLNHSGTGDFAEQKLDLDTKSTANVSLDMDKVNYMNNIHLTLNAVLGIDLDANKYTFKENKAKINELPLEFNGFIQLADNGQVYDLTFKTPTSSFKNFLGLIPSDYAAKLDGVTTTGDFTVAGFAKGILNKTSVPKFNIEIASNNASFQYPNLPKSVRNIVIDTKIINETGIMNDTYVNLDKLSFSIDKDIFDSHANIKNISTNALVDAAMKGTINLGNLSQAYPIKLKVPLSGILKADVTTKFDMLSVTNSDYAKINNAGIMSIAGFKYVDENNKTMTISNAAIQFNPSRVNLQQFNATTGKSDISVTGILDNFYGFMFKNQELKGNFNMVSNQIAVSDFMTSGNKTTSEKKSTSTITKKSDGMMIPAFLNCAITATANTVLYDNLILKNVSGKMLIADQKVTMQNVKTNIFGGVIGANGSVSTKGKVPVFDMNLNLNQVDISQSFTQLEMLKKMAPIAGIINGKFNSTIKLNGSLDNAMKPDISSIVGDLFGQLQNTTINESKSTLLTALTSSLKFIDLKKLNLNDIKANLTFANGKVNVKPFDIKYQDLKATIGGTHGFDQIMNYSIKFDVPAKYLGTEAGGYLGKLTATDIDKLPNIPVTAIITGNFSNPKITTDIKSGITTLATALDKKEKEKLITKGKNELGNSIDKLLKKDTTKAGNTQKDAIKEQAGKLLEGIFGKKN
ncbi:MAG: AsmA family protein [Flavobacterium sp.]|nr:AsmA family protein [Flavobacterium sp.]